MIRFHKDDSAGRVDNGLQRANPKAEKFTSCESLEENKAQTKKKWMRTQMSDQSDVRCEYRK